MKTAFSLFLLASLTLIGCRADLVAPESPIDWQSVTGIRWEIMSTTNSRFIPAGSTFLFGSENEFRGYVPGRKALCGEWHHEGNNATIQYDDEEESLIFDVNEVSQDSLIAVINLGDLSSSLLLIRDTRAANEFNQLAEEEPDDYTATDTTGRINRTDASDWLTSPEYVCQVNVRPPFPNPVNQGETITIPIEINSSQALPIGLVITSRRFAFGSFELREVGTYPFEFNASRLNRGLNRLYVFDERGRTVSFGDIFIR